MYKILDEEFLIQLLILYYLNKLNKNKLKIEKLFHE